MRLFYALELPADVRAALGQLQPRDENRDYRWVDPATMHLTLAFLGEQSEDRLPLLETVGSTAVKTARCGVLRLGQAGSFGSRRAPRVLWVDLTGDLDALLAVQSRLSVALRRANFPVEERPFAPHITLARRRETAHGGPPANWPPAVPRTSFALHELTLMQSRLSPRGPTYTPVAKFPIPRGGGVPGIVLRNPVK